MRPLARVLAIAAFCTPAPAQAPKESHVPITGPQEVIATVDGRGSAAGYVELPDASILMAHEVEGERGPYFSTSQDGGV